MLQHCCVEAVSLGRIVDDQNSTNGCYVNEVKIKAPTKIQDGDIVCFGAPEYGYKFRWEWPVGFTQLSSLHN